MTLASLRDRLPAVVNTPETRFQVDEERKFRVVQEVKERLAAEGATVNAIDGVRVSTPDGWWLLRASNSQDVLVAQLEKSGLNRSILDVAPYQIRAMLEYKAAWYGSRVIAVNPAYTSQTCSACGSVHPDNRTSQASFVCRECGHVDNADLNAAKNILRHGLATGGHPGMACGSNRASGRKQERRAVRRGSSALQSRE